jgi:hypothetical protein
MAKRLRSTKNIFNNRNATTIALIKKIDIQATNDYKSLNRLKGDLSRASRPETIAKISNKVSLAAVQMGLNPTKVTDKTKLMARITKYKQQNSYLQYAALHQAVIALCANYEDFIKRVVVKYFEEDVRRLTNTKQTVTNHFVIEAVKRGDNIHHTLAEHSARNLMHGSLKAWHDYLHSMGMDTRTVPHSVQETFLIRNCLVHNNRRISSELHTKNPKKYFLRQSIHLQPEDIEQMKSNLHASMKHIADEYDRLFPIAGGTWIDSPRIEED